MDRSNFLIGDSKNNEPGRFKKVRLTVTLHDILIFHLVGTNIEN